MKYKIQSTEKNTGLGADQETRALLYLLNDREDSNQFHWFVIDFFNDVTGINNSCTYSIDVQAKASKDIGAKQFRERFAPTIKTSVCDKLFHSPFITFDFFHKICVLTVIDNHLDSFCHQLGKFLTQGSIMRMSRDRFIDCILSLRIRSAFHCEF